MKKGFLLFCVLLLSLTLLAAKQSRQSATLGNDNLKALKAPKGTAILDYFDPASAYIYTWGGPSFYMSNLFKPEPGWYPFQVTHLFVLPARIDDLTTTSAAGTINRVRVFLPGSKKGSVTIAGEETNIPGYVGTWNTIALGSPVDILTGNFYAGMWNMTTVNDTASEGLWQGSVYNWTPPPIEPFVLIQNTNTTYSSAQTTGWTTDTPGYITTSAASIAVLCDGDTVPVELMNFSAE